MLQTARTLRNFPDTHSDRNWRLLRLRWLLKDYSDQRSENGSYQQLRQHEKAYSKAPVNATGSQILKLTVLSKSRALAEQSSMDCNSWPLAVNKLVTETVSGEDQGMQLAIEKTCVTSEISIHKIPMNTISHMQ